MNIIERIVNKYRKVIFNKVYRPKLKKESHSRLKGNFSIICNNCFGGMLYHDMGFKFLSPTINLYFEMEDYIKFLENLEFYLNCEITNGGSAESGVIGILNEKIKLYGIHYSTFEELKTKWDERKRRVNMENLYIIGIYRDGCTDDLVRRFCNLPYKNKVFLSHKEIDCSNNGCIVKVKSKKNAKEAPAADKMVSRKLRAYNAAFDFYEWIDD